MNGFYKQDCIYFLSDRPCEFHKQNNEIVCKTCSSYTPVNKKILVIKLAALGDVVRTTCILKPIHKYWKNSKIYWLTYDNAVDILKNNPYITEIIPYSQSFKIFNTKFDMLINLDLDNDALLLTNNIVAEKKYGFFLNSNNEIICSNEAAKYWFNLSHNDIAKKYNKKTYQQCMLEILELKNLKPKDCPIIINLTKEEKNFAKNFLKKNINSVKKSVIIGVNLGGGDKWQKKEYPVDKTVELIKLIVRSSKYKIKKKNVIILLFGGLKEKERNNKILSSLHTTYDTRHTKIIDTGYNNTLRQFFSLIDLCDLVVSSDTMALHVALALKKKVVALFGPTSPTEIEMYGLGKKIVSRKSCAVCYNRRCNKKPDCMDMISPKTVFNTICNLLKI